MGTSWESGREHNAIHHTTSASECQTELKMSRRPLNQMIEGKTACLIQASGCLGCVLARNEPAES